MKGDCNFEAVAVGAVQADSVEAILAGVVSSFAQRGRQVEYLALGHNVLKAFSESRPELGDHSAWRFDGLQVMHRLGDENADSVEVAYKGGRHA